MPILATGAILILFWILAIYSVSIHESFLLTLKLVELWQYTEAHNYFYFFRQLRNLVIAIILALIVYKIPLSFLKKEKNIILIFIAFLIFQLLVFIPWAGIALNWAKWWLYLPGMWTIQPSEFFKLGYVIFLSSWLLRKKKSLETKDFFTSFFIINWLILGIFLFIPDLWTVLVLWLVALVMARYAGVRAKIIWVILWSGLIIGVLVGSQFSYIRNRLWYFLDTTIDPNNRWIGWQTQQAIISIGGGGFTGKGYGKWLQKFWFIPEAQSDFIFAAFSEEIWFFGNSILLWLYLSLAFFFLSELHKVRDDYYKMLWVAIISLIIMQAFVNMGVNLRILPNTGLTLPFISFGGTALMVNLIQLSLLYKIIYKS